MARGTELNSKWPLSKAAVLCTFCITSITHLLCALRHFQCPQEKDNCSEWSASWCMMWGLCFSSSVLISVFKAGVSNITPSPLSLLLGRAGLLWKKIIIMIILISWLMKQLLWFQNCKYIQLLNANESKLSSLPLAHLPLYSEPFYLFIFIYFVFVYEIQTDLVNMWNSSLMHFHSATSTLLMSFIFERADVGLSSFSAFHSSPHKSAQNRLDKGALMSLHNGLNARQLVMHFWWV